MNGIRLKRSYMKSKKKLKKRPERHKAAESKYSIAEIMMMARNRPPRPKKFRYPHFEYDKEDFLRLMKRVRPTVEKENEYLYHEGCPSCTKDHWDDECPCLDKIPPGTVLGPLYDWVCNCCGKIGDECCSNKGSYAILAKCGDCMGTGHWYWEKRCPKDWCRPSNVIEIPSIEELEREVMQNKGVYVVEEYEKNSIKEAPSTDQSLVNSLQEEDKVMVDVGKDNEDKNEVMVEDDNSKEDDEAKGGIESSNQNRSEKKKQLSGFSMISIKRTNENHWSISKPDVFKSPYSDSYVIFGEAKIADLCSQPQTEAAYQLRMRDMSPVMAKLEISGAGAGAPADGEVVEIDETGVEPRDIDLVMTQEQCLMQY